MDVEVVYALSEEQTLLRLRVEAGASIEQTIRASGVLERHPEIELSEARVGVFGRLCTLNEPVGDGDRIEIHRPLACDPKLARRERASHAKRSNIRRT